MWFSLPDVLSRKCWCQYGGFWIKEAIATSVWDYYDEWESYLKNTLRTLTLPNGFCFAYDTVQSLDAPKRREDFNFRQRTTTVATIEVLTKEEVIEFKETYENLSDTDFNSKMFDMSPLIKKLQENLRNLKDVLSK